MQTSSKLIQSYVYWTLHRIDSWIKIDQIDVTCFIISLFTAQHVSNFSTSIFRSLRLIVDLFHVLYSSGSMCVGVTVWFGWGGVVSLCRLKLRIEPEQYNTRNKSKISRKLLKMNVLTFESCWAVNNEIKNQVDNKLVYLYSNSYMFRHRVSFSGRLKHIHTNLTR
jgi:hypothetical protein